MKRIDELLRVPAEIRFLSVEPLLAPVDLSPWCPLEYGLTLHPPENTLPPMSRYGYYVEGYEDISVVGWDPPLRTHYAQISHNNDPTPDDERPTRCWIGQLAYECPTVEELDGKLKGHGLQGLPQREHPGAKEDLWDLLRLDKKMSR